MSRCMSCLPFFMIAEKHGRMLHVIGWVWTPSAILFCRYGICDIRPGKWGMSCTAGCKCAEVVVWIQMTLEFSSMQLCADFFHSCTA